MIVCLDPYTGVSCGCVNEQQQLSPNNIIYISQEIEVARINNNLNDHLIKENL